MIEIILFCILLFYIGFILQLIFGFNKVKSFVKTNKTPTTAFTIIVPFRNEEKNLPKLLGSFSKLNYPHELIEIILVDDFSKDLSERICIQWRMQNDDIDTTLLENLRLSNSPKKDAISRAMPIAKNPWIITTDADCIVPPNWLLLYHQFIEKNKPVFVAAPVMFIEAPGILNHFQVLDFLALQGITAAAVGAGKHSMSNGANLGFEKTAFIAVGGYQGVDHIASGDDMFLMHKMKQTLHKPVGYLFHPDAIVLTAAMDTWKGFIMQRIRWASKARYLIK